MIKTNTVFILGAGASKPFNYPTGIELRKNIYAGINGHTLAVALSKYDSQIDEYLYIVEDFQKTFLNSARLSIDTFLEHQPRFMDIGKMAIALAIAPCETHNYLFKNLNWYSYLFDRLRATFEEFKNNAISFITFNYDRSLEHFLFTALQHSYPEKTNQECAEVLSNIPIVHLYGQLDPLPWQVKRGGIPYGTTDDIYARLRSAKDSIELIPEGENVASNQNFIDAYKLIENAKRIYFLGFGYDPLNLRRLNVVLMQDAIIEGTIMDLEASKLDFVKTHFNANDVHIGDLINCSALDFLKARLPIED